ncbi:MAG: hypothetical protein ABI593_01705 [Betaproteobacteria bacterium]
MTRSTKWGWIIAAAAAFMSASALADNDTRRYCSDSLVRGTYAAQLQGKLTLPDGSTQEIIGVVIRVYDGNGGVMQWDNVKNSVTGYVPNRYGTGTYQVNDDCTVDIVFHPAPTATLQERAVIVDNGRELRSITVLPAGLFVTAIHQRI